MSPLVEYRLSEGKGYSFCVYFSPCLHLTPLFHNTTTILPVHIRDSVNGYTLNNAFSSHDTQAAFWRRHDFKHDFPEILKVLKTRGEGLMPSAKAHLQIPAQPKYTETKKQS